MKNKKKYSEVVVITGASAGVGRATAQEFARHGAKLALLARDPIKLESTQKEVKEMGAEEVIFIPTDVSQYDSVEKAANEIEKYFGHIDIWINNAMVTVFSPINEMTAHEFKKVTDTTYLGSVYGTMVALKKMRPRNQGTIIQVGSALAYRAIPLQSAYCASKHAVEGFTESLRSELYHDHSKIHVSMVQLPAINTPQFKWNKAKLSYEPQPVPPIYQPEVAARAIYWAAHKKKREVFVGFPTVLSIWGNRYFPKFVDWYLGKVGYKKQQTHHPLKTNRANNLNKAVPIDYGSHGDFDDHSRNYSWQFFLNRNKEKIITGLFFLLGGFLSYRSFHHRKKRWGKI